MIEALAESKVMDASCDCVSVELRGDDTVWEVSADGVRFEAEGESEREYVDEALRDGESNDTESICDRDLVRVPMD